MNQRFANIDALRGIAALLVVIHHASEGVVRALNQSINDIAFIKIASEFDFGRMGIVCFFLISGYVIPSSLNSYSNRPIRAFAIRRFFRLYPLYWLSLVSMSLVLFVWYGPLPFTNILANTTMIQGFLGEPHIIGFYWTLQIEIVFYLLCIVLFRLRVLKNNKFICVLILALVFIFGLSQIYNQVFHLPEFLNKEFQILPYFLAIMFCGTLLRRFHEANKQDEKLKSYLSIALAICFIPPLLMLIMAGFEINFIEDQFRFGAGHFFGLCLFLLGLKIFKKAHPILLWLGAISYSIYLFHPVILRAIQANITYISHLSIPVLVMITLVITLLIAHILFKYFEKPLINYGNSLAKKDG